MMKYTLLALLLSASTAHATIGSYDYWWPKDVATYFEKLNRTQLEPHASDKTCQPVYESLIEKGSLNINYAFGYFDESTANSMVLTHPNFQISPALDGISFDVVRNFMTAPCDLSTEQRLCGFQQTGDPQTGKVVLTKTIQMLDRSVLVTMTLTHASASESFNDNKGPLRPRQTVLTAQSEENYFEGLKTADIIIYNGHSRNGGGPDFNPPLLKTDDLMVNYPVYEKQRVGITRLLKSLKASGRSDQIVAMFSCFTHRHFYKQFMAVNPHQRLILSEDEVNYLDTLMASLGYLEAMLRAECGNNVDKLALQSDYAKSGFTDWNFGSTSMMSVAAANATATQAIKPHHKKRHRRLKRPRSLSISK